MTKIGSIAVALAVSCASVFAEPSGLNEIGQLRPVVAAGASDAFAFVRLDGGVQFRVNGVTKNVLFYGPDTVRVNANAGQSHWARPNIVVDAKPADVAFEVKDAGDSLTITR